jgi:hypothetical protein
MEKRDFLALFELRRKGWNSGVGKLNSSRYAALFVLLLAAFAGRATAQSTIFNIPTTDTAAKGTVYAEFDFLVQAPGSGDSRTYLYNPRLVVGLPANLEVGVNFPTANTRESGMSSTYGYIQPNMKWKIYDDADAGFAVSAGGVLNTPLNKRESQDSWGLIYGLMSKKFQGSDYGPRFHVGPYGILSANQNEDEGPVSFVGPRAGVILGYEQPVHSNVSIVADWFSGENAYGYFTPGISITLPGNGLLNVGYSFGNDSWRDSNASKNRYFFVYYGVTF